jgi:hypothetical protein
MSAKLKRDTAECEDIFQAILSHTSPSPADPEP